MNFSNKKISATIITKNEEANIAECLESLSWADEIVVLDSGSTDRTMDIARKYSDKVFAEPWKGQGHQKNRAVELAQGPWIFSIDADERVTPELAQEIRNAVQNASSDVYALRRKNFYKDQWIRHGGWWPDYVKRLFRKDKAQFNDRVIHDSLQTASRVGKLSNPLHHYSFRSVEDFLDRAYWYAAHQAREMYREGRRASAWTAISHAGVALFQSYFLRLGFMEGGAGLLIAVSNFAGVFYRYMILRELSLHGEYPIPRK
jgi:glycosyltransferase involved in cell wall biosynthesis